MTNRREACGESYFITFNAIKEHPTDGLLVDERVDGQLSNVLVYANMLNSLALYCYLLASARFSFSLFSNGMHSIIDWNLNVTN